MDEDLSGLRVDVLPSRLVVDREVRAEAADQLEQVGHAAVDVGLVGVCVGADHVLHFGLLVVLDEVPNLLVRAQLVEEAALAVLDLALLDGVVGLVALRHVALVVHLFAQPLLQQERVDLLFDLAYARLALALLAEAAQHDEVLDVLDHLIVDAPQGSRARKPLLLLLRLIRVVRLPDPRALKHHNSGQSARSAVARALGYLLRKFPVRACRRRCGGPPR